LSLPRILKWEKDNIQYCKICRVEFDNIKEKVVIISGCNSLVHEICINRFQYNEMCPTCNVYYFIYIQIKDNTENDINLFDSKTFERNYINIKKIRKKLYIPFRLKEADYIPYHFDNFKLRNYEILTFYVLSPNIPIRFYFE
jgi:hypothetical protein